MTTQLKKAKVALKGSSTSRSVGSSSICPTPSWPDTILGDDCVYMKEFPIRSGRNISRSLDSLRWAYETTHYLNQPTPQSLPITIQRLKDVQFKIMRTALFRIIRYNFLIPLSFKITEVVYPTKPHTLHKRTMACEEIRMPVILRTLATAKPCERETEKCRQCGRRYRCITQRSQWLLNN